MTPAPPRPVIISAFGPPALACIRSWGKRGLIPGMVCIRPDGQPPPKSRYLCSHASLRPQELYTEAGAGKVTEYLKAFRATGIIAINEDVSCWLNESPRLAAAGISVWASSNGVLREVVSKRNQLEVAHRVGLTVLPTYMVDKQGHDLDAIPSSHFPLCLRPDAPGSVSPPFKVKIAYDRDDLARHLETLGRIDSPIVAQPFRNLPNLVVHGARTTDGRAIGLQAFLVERKFQGVTLTIRPAPLAPGLGEKCAAFAEDFRLTGSYHFEFLADPSSGEHYFLEINARLGGTTAKVYACGYDEPLLNLEAYGVCESGRQNVRNHVVSSKNALIKYCLYALRNRLTPFDYPDEPRLTRLLKSLYALAACRDEVLAFSDLSGSYAFYRTLRGRRS